jgi:peptidoglycan hydrolase-like protein with peptidoglycan-binding domain
MTLVAAGAEPVLKLGSTGPAVRRVQRALNAATPGTELLIGGVFNKNTDRALRAFQRKTRVAAEGVVNPRVWTALTVGARS